VSEYDNDDPWAGDHDWAIPATPRKRRHIDIGQDRNTYRVLRENFRLRCMAAREPCWLCGGAIDYSARSGPRAFELDHEHPVSVAPELALVESNFRPSHSLCNRRRQAADAVLLTGEPSEEW
jgi:hypothetical protein